MYGTMEQSIESKRPLLAKREDMHQTVNNESSFRSSRALKMMDEVAGTRMMRTSGVLASIMEKSRNGHGHIYGTSITRHMSECSDTIELSTQRTPKSFVYTMLNPRSKSVEAVSFKWFITLVIVAVSGKQIIEQNAMIFLWTIQVP